MIMILLTVIHVIVCIFLILVVLLQQGKSADWSGTFGGGSSQTAFGQRGTATILCEGDDGGRDHFHDDVACADDRV